MPSGSLYMEFKLTLLYNKHRHGMEYNDMFKNTKFLLTLITLLMVAGFVVAQDDMGDDDMGEMGPSVMVSPEEVVRLGYAGALSGEGLVQLGVDIQRGMELALDDRPTVTVDGVEFEVMMDAQDDMCSPEGGQTVANRFVSDESIVALVGPMCSSACEASAPIFDEAMYSVVSASCTAANLTQNDSFSFNRTVGSDGAQGAIAARYIFEELGAERIALIDDSSAYGVGLADVIEAEFEALGGEVVARDGISVGDTDFRALLQDILLEDPDLIHFSGFPAEGARLLDQRFDVGLEDVPFMSADGLRVNETIELAGESAEGLIVTAPIPTEGEALDEYLQQFEETYNEAPATAFNSNAYDATNLILDAVEAVGYVDDRGDLVVERIALQEYIRSAEFSGVTGEYACDGTGECAVVSVGVSQVQDGEFELLTTITTID